MSALVFLGNLVVAGFISLCMFGCAYHLILLFEQRYRRPTRR